MQERLSEKIGRALSPIWASEEGRASLEEYFKLCANSMLFRRYIAGGGSPTDFFTDLAELTTGVMALQSLVPLSEAHGEEIERILDETVG